MNDFFTNLINRHQGRVETVAPRAQSYYEEESRPANPGAGDLSQTAVQQEQDQPVVSGQISSPQPPAGQDKSALDSSGQLAAVRRPAIASGDTYFAQADSQQGTDVTQTPVTGQNFARPEPGVEQSTQRVDSSHGFDRANETIHRSEAPMPPDSVSMVDTNQRIDAVLNRIRSHLKPQAGNESPNYRQDKPERRHDHLNDTGAKTDAGLLQHGSVPPVVNGPDETIDRESGSGQPGSQNNLNRGALEVPVWLKQQTDFNLKDAQSLQSSEPIVNVSIGRVEVRAVRESRPRSGSSKAKPSGVMSLDEYLDKRQRKGVV